MRKTIVVALIAVIASWILLGASAFAGQRAIFYVVQAQPQQQQTQQAAPAKADLQSPFHSDEQISAPLPANAVIVKSSDQQTCRCGPGCQCAALEKSTTVTKSTSKRYRSIKYQRNQPGYTASSGDSRSTGAGFVQLFRIR